MRPDGPPLGLLLATTSKAVGRAFNDALGANGGSIPIWLILNALKSEPRRTQLDLARAVGIEGPTLTRHLDGMEQAGLVRRQRGTLDRRAVQVELTRAGHALHGRLLKAVISFVAASARDSAFRIILSARSRSAPPAPACARTL